MHVAPAMPDDRVIVDLTRDKNENKSVVEADGAIGDEAEEFGIAATSLWVVSALRDEDSRQCVERVRGRLRTHIRHAKSTGSLLEI